MCVCMRVWRGGSLEISVECEDVFRFLRHDSRLLVLSNPLLKEVGLSLQWNVLHEVKGVLNIVHLQREQNSAEWVWQRAKLEGGQNCSSTESRQWGSCLGQHNSKVSSFQGVLNEGFRYTCMYMYIPFPVVEPLAACRPQRQCTASSVHSSCLSDWLVAPLSKTGGRYANFWQV